MLDLAPPRLHVRRNGRAEGPYAAAYVRQLLASGAIGRDDLVWVEGTPSWTPLSATPGFEDLADASAHAGPVAPAYHHVSPVKFAVMSFGTVGLYETYWFYRNWRFVRERDRSRILPFARAVFSPFWCYPLSRDLAHTQGQPIGWAMVALAAAYLLTAATWRLPDPWWLLSSFTFVPLLPLVVQIDAINRGRGARAPAYTRFGIRHGVVCLCGTLLLLFVALPALLVLPSTAVVDGSRLPARVLRLLEEEAGLYRSESVIYFYSGAIFSFRGDGNVVTDQGVISYYPDPDTGELIVFKAAYEDIVDVQVTYPESFLEDTVVEILIGEEERFLLFASRERGRDRLFVDELVRRWKQQREATAPRGGVA